MASRSDGRWSPGGLLVMVTLHGDVADMKSEVSGIHLGIKKIGDVLITQPDQNRRILHLQEDCRELRYGHGFIQTPERALW